MYDPFELSVNPSGFTARGTRSAGCRQSNSIDWIVISRPLHPAESAESEKFDRNGVSDLEMAPTAVG